jgi:MoxR-like ATPase
MMGEVDLAFLRKAFETENYICEDELLITVSLALKLGRPLLVEGAPGVGKTEIAKVLASVLATDLIRLQCYEGLDESKALYEWNYQGQLLKIQMMRDSAEKLIKEEELFSPQYLLARPLLQAIQADQQVVLLIDEIDKTDEEFEAFLFEVLSDFQVSIPELGTLKARHLPVVVLTSNQERELSDGLRRRCVYLYIDYPSADKESEILRRKIPTAGARLIWELSAAVQYMRYELELEKPPSTSETLDWATVLADWDVERLEPSLIQQTLGLLLKNHHDVLTFGQKIGCEGLCSLLRQRWDGRDLQAKGESLLARALKKKFSPG